MAVSREDSHCNDLLKKFEDLMAKFDQLSTQNNNNFSPTTYLIVLTNSFKTETFF